MIVELVAAKLAVVGKRLNDASSHLASAAGAGWAIIAAIDANTVQLWGGVILAFLAALWGHLREQKRRDFDDAERRKLLKVLVDANETAIKAKLPIPYPEVITLLVKGPAGVIETETKTPASE